MGMNRIGLRLRTLATYLKMPVGRFDQTSDVSAPDIMQGDILPGRALPVLCGSRLRWIQVDQIVVLTQTCDLVQNRGATAIVAPLCHLPTNKVGNARRGTMPRYVHVPNQNSDTFVDLDYMATIPKGDLQSVQPVRPLRTHDERRRFAQEVGRRLSRFPFPDEVVPWFQPLQRVAQDKAPKAMSPEGRAFDLVNEFRVESLNGWESPPFDLLLCVLVKPGELPVFPDDQVPDLPAELATQIRPNGTLATSAKLSECLRDANTPVERYFLWAALGDAWAVRCVPSLGEIGDIEVRRQVSHAVLNGSIAAEVLSTDEYTLARMRRSERLDLAHLSSPLPE